MSATHQIETIRYDDDAKCAVWRCQCGYEEDGYGGVEEARYAAAAHQLSDAARREMEGADTVAEWRKAVVFAAQDAAGANPAAWRWWTTALWELT